jgi:hypothetical protein
MVSNKGNLLIVVNWGDMTYIEVQTRTTFHDIPCMVNL